jgi:hypothetical protein
MRDNEYVPHPSRPLAPAWAVLNSQHLIVMASMIPKTLFYTNISSKSPPTLIYSYNSKKYFIILLLMSMVVETVDIYSELVIIVHQWAFLNRFWLSDICSIIILPGYTFFLDVKYTQSLYIIKDYITSSPIIAEIFRLQLAHVS